MRITLKRGNDQIITLHGLRAADTQLFLNAATVKGTLFNSKGQPVPAFQDVVMPYVSASDGDYEWFIESHLSMLPKSVEYSLVITAEENGLDYRTVRVVTVED